MKKKSLLFFILLIFVTGFSSCGKGTDRRNSEEIENLVEDTTAVYRNPVLNRNFPDPTVIKAPDDYYYAYGTNTEFEGNVVNIQVVRSKDMINWEDKGDALPEKPSWADKDFWAPHVFYDEKSEIYHLYYSGESRGDTYGKCLGVATSRSPSGPFEDKGEALLCGEGFINIDPMAFDDPITGKKLLYWGSGFGSIKVQELADDRINFKEGTIAKDLIHPVPDEDPGNYQKLVEGVWISRYGKYFYLYYAGDNCCGDKAHYATMIARSTSATGPFETYEEVTESKNSVILERNARWIAPGHNSVIRDEAGQDWIVYHAIDSLGREKGRVMLLDKISYENGWPVIEEGTPSTEKKAAPVVANKPEKYDSIN